MKTEPTPRPALGDHIGLSPRAVKTTTAVVMVAMFMSGIDGTAVATAMPTVIRDLNGIDQYAWVFSGYLLAQIATIPLWGKLADMYGRKPILISGLALFLSGSALCGIAGSMMQLIVFRAIQGLGAGCLMPVPQTIIADLYTLEQRARMQAVFSAQFAVAAVVGPWLGGWFTDHASWRWIFYVNLPIGLVAIVLIQRVFVDPALSKHRHRLDVKGVMLLVGWTTILLYALETGGRDYPWGSWQVMACVLASAALLVTFVRVELRTDEPLVPLQLLRVVPLRAALINAVLIGMVMFGAISYLPLFSQTVVGTTATGSGRAITPLMLGVVSASAFGARVVLRLGFRAVLMIGAAFLGAGAFFLQRLSTSSHSSDVVLSMIMLGVGMGCSMVVTVLAVQNSVATDRMGVATGLLNFVRQLGGSIGVAIAGAVMLDSLSHRLSTAFPGQGIDAARLMGGPGASTSGSFATPTAREAVRHAFAGALHQTFLVTCALIALAALSALLMPKGSATAIRDHARGPVEIEL